MKLTMFRVLAPAVTMGMLATVSLAGTFNAADWAESVTNTSDVYTSPDQGPISVVGGQLIASIPTDYPADSITSGDGNEGVNYVRTWTVAAGLPSYTGQYNGSLLGNLSGAPFVTATFSINNSTLAPGAQFQASEFVAQGITTEVNSGFYLGTPSPALRFVFTDASTGDVWYSAPISVLSMYNDTDVAYTVSLSNLSDWSDINGISATSTPAAFESALTDVSKLGFGFGSGYFGSDGFSFNTGGTASLDIASIQTAPEPISMIFFGTGLVAVGGYISRRRMARKA